MKIETFLKSAITKLSRAGIETARLDCLVLLEDVLNTNRTRILSQPDTPLTEVELKKLEGLLHKRVQHIPLAYIRGKTEFYGREFIVTPAVLEPRPESETMIEILKSLSLPADSILLDVGTGSGALGITAALEVPAGTVALLDIDPSALKVAEQNANRYSIEARIIENDLLTDLNQPFDLLLCNLPYVPDDFSINTAASHEPKLAIFGGTDGLDIYRRLFSQLTARQTKPRFVLTESLPFQHTALREIGEQAGFSLSRTEDFIQLFEAL